MNKETNDSELFEDLYCDEVKKSKQLEEENIRLRASISKILNYISLEIDSI